MCINVITGANGFIGKNLFNAIYNNKDFFILADREFDSAFDVDKKYPNIVKFNADLSLRKNCDRLYRLIISYHGDDAEPINLYHLAAVVGVQNWIGDHAMHSFLNNKDINDNIIRYFNHRYINIIFASTSEVYGDNCNASEEEKYFKIMQHQRGLYSLDKITFENFLKYYFLGKYIIVRFFNVIGKGQHADKGVMAKIVNCIKTGGTFNINGDGDQKRAYISVLDAVNVVKSLVLEKNFGIFNVGNPNNYYSINEVLEKFKNSLNRNNLNYQLYTNKKDQNSASEIYDRRPNCSKISKYMSSFKNIDEIIDSLLIE